MGSIPINRLKGTVATTKAGKVDIKRVAEHYMENMGNIPEHFGFARAAELHMTISWLVKRIEYLEKKYDDVRFVYPEECERSKKYNGED